MSPPDSAAASDAPRAILHVDMDAFFASIEQLDDPRLAGRPVLVGHDGPRGVVSAASYEARVFGCRSAQPMARARRLCPQAVVVAVRFERYREVSRAIFAIFSAVTPRVEPLSVDEAFLDVTGCERLHGPPATLAAELKRSIRAATGLTASIGVAPNKFLAKLASDWEKPDGLCVITAAEAPARLAPLPLRAMWGVGPATEARLAAAGLHRFGDLQALSPEQALARCGPHGAHLRELSFGRDSRPVVPDSEARSLGAEETFAQDLRESAAVRAVLAEQLLAVSARLRQHGLAARTVTLKLRYGDFETITRSTTLAHATDRSDVLRDSGLSLFDAWAARSFRPVRLVGAALAGLAAAGSGQGQLFTDPAEARARRLDAALDAVRGRFGAGAVRRGTPPPER